jgi:dTDP-4-dehydrorhamnose 3,5-epimerase
MGKLKKISTKIEGVSIIRPMVFRDDRGFFLETYNKQDFAEIGIHEEFVQDNVSHSVKGVVRGLHYQTRQAQGKLVRVIQGKIFDVVVDIRKGSPTYGHHIEVEMSINDPSMLYVPIGFAHGFMALEDATEVMYKVTDYYAPDYDAGIVWNDPDLNISWPIRAHGIIDVRVSPKDAALPRLKDIRSPFDQGNKLVL